MPAEEIRRWLQRQPFRAFRIWILEQTSYEVHHPELIVVNLATLAWFVPSQQMGNLAELQITVALRHITKLEELPKSSSGSGKNGNVSKNN